MNNTQYDIMRHVQRLDNASIDYEARWGIGRLPSLASKELREKWDRQWQRFDEAVSNQDIWLVEDLAQGCIRAWVALEAEAIKSGHAPIDPDAWEVRHPESGQVYRICRNLSQARTPAAQGVVTYTLEEIANILEAKQLANVARSAHPVTPSRLDPIDWERGDDIPF